MIMKTLKILITLSIFVLSASVNSANLIHSYLFGGDYSDSTGTIQISNTGGSLSGGRYFFEGADGLTLNGALTNTSSYSIEMVMSTDVVDSGYNKLIDFQNLVQAPQIQ